MPSSSARRFFRTAKSKKPPQLTHTGFQFGQIKIGELGHRENVGDKGGGIKEMSLRPGGARLMFMAMSDSKDPVKEREYAQKFVQFVMIQAQNVMYVLGKIPTPDGQRVPPNLEAAKMLIDQLEVIKYKTRGNLIAQEEKLLAEALSSVQLAFVEASGGTPASLMPDRDMGFDMPQDDDFADDPAPTPQPSKAEQMPTPSSPPAADTPAPKVEEPKKKFFKSYG